VSEEGKQVKLLRTPKPFALFEFSFFLWMTISMATFPWKFLLGDYVPCSVTVDAT
jgi:hypothetical protein